MFTHLPLPLRALLVLLFACCALIGCADTEDDGGRSRTSASVGEAPVGDPSGTAGHVERTDSYACTEPTSVEGCGISQTERRDLNLSYADRVDFHGDPAEAEAVAAEVRQRLEPLTGSPERPTELAMAAALDGMGGVDTSTNAVRMAGTAFAVYVDGGCVFGAIYDGELWVEVGGYVKDGGCLAENAH